mgnify:CR=1 FL=1
MSSCNPPTSIEAPLVLIPDNLADNYTSVSAVHPLPTSPISLHDDMSEVGDFNIPDDMPGDDKIRIQTQLRRLRLWACLLYPSDAATASDRLHPL